MLFKFEGIPSKEVVKFSERNSIIVLIVVSIVSTIVPTVILSIISPPAGLIYLPFALLLCGGAFVLQFHLMNHPKKRTLEITELDFTYSDKEHYKTSFSDYRLNKIEDHGNFFVFYLPLKISVDKASLVVGTMEEFEKYYKDKIVAPGEQVEAVDGSHEDELPFEMPEAPESEFYPATVISKGIGHDYSRSRGIYLIESAYPYFMTFLLNDGRELTLQVSERIFCDVNENDRGTLVLVNEHFFDFEVEKAENK